MKLEKRSSFAEAWGNTFEVPPKTRWLTVDMRGYVFASESEENPVPLVTGDSEPLMWDHHGHGFYVGKVTLFGFDWKEMVEYVGSSRFRLDKHVADEVKKVTDYCAETIGSNKTDNAPYFAQMLRMLSERILKKID